MIGCLRVDEEFKSLLAILTDEEHMNLEQGIVNSGRVLQPILVWDGTIIDGHNRYEIAQMHGIGFETREMMFDSKEDAKIWIIKHQMGRRNLNDFQRAEMAIKLKHSIEVKAKTNQRAAGGAVPMKSTEPVNTREELALIASVSEDTIRKVEKIIDKAPIADLNKLRAGECSINSAFKKVQYSSEPQSDPSVNDNAGVQKVVLKIQKLAEQTFGMRKELSSADREVVRGVIHQLNEALSLIEEAS